MTLHLQSRALHELIDRFLLQAGILQPADDGQREAVANPDVFPDPDARDAPIRIVSIFVFGEHLTLISTRLPSRQPTRSRRPTGSRLAPYDCRPPGDISVCRIRPAAYLSGRLPSADRSSAIDVIPASLKTDILSLIIDSMSENTSALASPRSRRELEQLPTKSERTRQAIIENTLEFFWTHPFRDLSVGELMARVGASRPTFYQYFADLHELMAVLLDSLRVDVFSVTAPWFEGRGNPVPHLRAALAGLVNVCYERGTLLRAVADAAVSDANLEKAWAQFLKSFDVAVAARIEQQQAEGFIEPFPAYPVAVALDRLNASVLIEHFGKRPRGKRDEVLSALTRIWSSTLYRTAGK